jgi:hypothetical protein
MHRYAGRMLPPGLPPSWLFIGSMFTKPYPAPPARSTARASLSSVTLALTVPSLPDPELSWISCKNTTSGDCNKDAMCSATSRRWWTRGDRFST